MTLVRSLDTVKDLRLFYENLLDDAPDVDFTYQQLSAAKNRIEVENKLFVLQDEDATQVAAAGDTYAVTHSLPERWRMTRYMKIGSTAFFPTKFEKRMDGQARRFFIDYRNKKFGFTGTLGMAGAIRHGYLRATDDFVSAAEETTKLADVLEWPVEFAPIIAYEAAGFFQEGVDTDEISTTKGMVQLNRAASLLDAFIGWDHDQKLGEMGDRGGYADEDESVDVGSL